MSKRKILRKMSDYGWLVEVPVSDDPNGPKCIVLDSDWNELLQQGMSPMLSVNTQGYVVAWCPSRRVYKRLAKLIMNASTLDEVSTLDGSELNLIRWNIKVTPGVYLRSFLSKEDVQDYSSLVEYETDWGHDPYLSKLSEQRNNAA